MDWTIEEYRDALRIASLSAGPMGPEYYLKEARKLRSSLGELTLKWIKEGADDSRD